MLQSSRFLHKMRQNLEEFNHVIKFQFNKHKPSVTNFIQNNINHLSVCLSVCFNNVTVHKLHQIQLWYTENRSIPVSASLTISESIKGTGLDRFCWCKGVSEGLKKV